MRAHFLNDCAPSTYVVCADDRATEPARQRAFAKRAAQVVELEAGRHPFLSRPAELAAAIAGARSANGLRTVLA